MTIPHYKKIKKFFTSSMWFIFGAIFGFFFFISFLHISYKHSHNNLVYEGILINDIDFGGKTKEEIKSYFSEKNENIKNTSITLIGKDLTATISAEKIDFGYDEDLLAEQAFSLGRSNSFLSDMSLMLQAYMQGVTLSPAYRYKEGVLDNFIKMQQAKIDIKPVDALFKFENNKVTAFQLSKDGSSIDVKKLKGEIISKMAGASFNTPQTITLSIPVITVEPKIKSEDVNKMGIKELIGRGTSLFRHSIENRIYNLTLASSSLNGVLIPPGQVFSTTKTIGDITALTGYKQAYVIANGKTVLGDGGGVCQVSTTLFRAALNAGLPIVERNPHAYRVGYYEQDSLPGIDAAIYYPTVDLKFKNDTGNYILIQTFVDPNEQRLTFELYGTSDNRETVINQPVILSQSPAPETVYQDDPTLPKGQIKQVDFAAGGANVYFTRTVKKDGKEIISDKFVSNYRPWRAIFLRGTKE
jgi:vancomycin resistance protein YoaR